MGKRLEIKAGDTFGKWTVLEESAPRKNSRRFTCKCGCGTVKEVALAALTSGHSLSCGCTVFENGCVSNRVRHGFRNHPLYPVYSAAKRRCNDPKDKDYPNYGGRGIKFFKKWEEHPETFFEWAETRWAKGLQLNRMDNNKDYCPDNCNFVSPKDNANNRRCTSRINGVALRDIYDKNCKCDLTYRAFYQRVVRKGWEIERALSTPVKQTRKK